jgi:putative drug exporter of the RND superfamily
MQKLGAFIIGRSKLALWGFIALVLFSTIWGFQAFAGLKAGGYDDPGSDSARVVEILTDDFKQAIPEVIIIADFADGADQPASAITGKNLTSKLESYEGVETVTSYYSLGSPVSLRSDDGNAVYFFVDLNDEAKQVEVGAKIADELTGSFESAKLYVAGYAPINAAINGAISSDLATAESIAIPLTMILLLFVFGSLVSAGLPMMVGGLAILGSFFFVWVSTQLTDTSVFALNLITGMGLGLGIDYALLIVNRFREERKQGTDVSEAVRRTLATAGRTVLFSGLTVAIVLGAMFFFPQYFLKSFAIGGVVVVLLAVAGALIALPALLNLMGDRINKLKVIRGDLSPKDSGIWSSLARFVMRRPLPILLVTMIALGGLMSLSGSVVFGQVDDRVLPRTNPAVIASDVIRDRFSAREGSPVDIVIEGATQNEIVDYTIALSKQPHILRVQSTAGIAQKGNLDDGYAPAFADYATGSYERVVAIHDIDSRSTEGLTLTKQVRALTSGDNKILVGGSAAVYTDSQLGIEKNLPAAATWIITWTLLLLFLFTGSVLLPIKAVLLNFVSLGATLGFLTWVFIGGHLQWLIGDFINSGTIDTSSLVLIVIVAFGLSMDYELFLLSRIKEQHEAGLGTTESVAIGLQRSGRIITAAALVLAVSFLAFVTSGVTIMKMLGLGIAFAILLDATIVRALLVPALMRLLGDLNWWAPKWMKAIYKKVGLDH